MKKMYCLVVTDDYSRFSWVFFLATKDETSEILKTFITSIENLIDLKVKVIRCDNGTEFKNKVMNQFCEMKGIKREFSVARTPQQNRVAERKNRTLIEAARLKQLILLVMYKIGCSNKSMNYDPIVTGNQSNGSAGTKACDDVGKARMETVPGKDYILLPFLTQDPSFSSSSKDSPDAGFKPSGEEEKKDAKDPENEDSEVPNTEEPRVNQEQDANVNSTNNINTVSPTVNAADIENNVADENIVYGCDDDPNMPNLEEIVYSNDDDEGVDAKVDMTNLDTHILVSPTPTTRIHKDHPLEQIIGDIHLAPQTRRMTKNVTEHVEPKKVIQALQDPSWIEAIQEELLPFKLPQVWTLMDLPHGKRAIDTKWVDTLKKRELIMMRFLLQLLGLKQLAVLSLWFEDPEFPDKVYKVEKALYGLHQAPRACTPMETSKPLLKDAEAKDVDIHLYRSMIGSLMYLTASRPDIMFVVCACVRFQVTPKVSHLHAVKRIFRYLKGQPKLGLWYPKDSPFDLEAYTDSDYAGASLDRKSTTGGCQFLGSRLISWQCKKQTIVANSTTEAEYVAASSYCGQVLWIQNQMLDYGYNFMNTKIYIDNESTICIVKNPVFHSKTKHIEIRHHFIRDSNEKKLIQMSKIHTDHNVADLLTKAFDVDRFQYLIETNETVIKEWEDRMERAATIASSLEVEQDSGNINTTQSMATLNESFPQSNDPPLSRVNTLGSGEDIMKLKELMDLYTKLPEKLRLFLRHLKLEDSDGISNLPTTKIFEQLALMGRLTRQESVVPQPRSPTQTNVADEAASTGMDVRLGGSTTTVTGLEAGQGSGNIDKTPTMPYDSPRPTVHTLGSDEGRKQHNELMDFVTKLSDRVVALETDLTQTKKIYGAAFTKLIKKVKTLEKTVKSSQARRKARIVVSDDKEDLEDPSKQGRKIADIDEDPNISLFTALEEVYTAEKGVSTTEPVSTAGASVSTASASSAKDKGKDIIEEAKTIQTKTKLQLEQERLGYEEALRLHAKINEEERHRIARVQKEASSFNTKEWDNIQARVEADEKFSQRLQSEEKEMYTLAEKERLLVELSMRERGSHTLKQLTSYSFDEIKNLYETTMRKVHTFIPMESKSERVIPELAAGSSKRDVEEELVQDSSKRPKTRESSEPAEEPKDKDEEELSQERIHQMMIIVPEQGMNVKALQTKYPIIDWEIYTEGARKYWKIIRVGNHTEVYQFFDDMLKAFDREDIVKRWSLVKEKFTSTKPTEDKEREIWVELKRLFEPDTDDELLKL
ncbi:putative ribonuclease H-like domain-containing protein [Tanacetum coccineum]